MLAIREEELNMVNGGNALEVLISDSKFNVGQPVIFRGQEDYGVGVVLSKSYKKGWHYHVAFDNVMVYAREEDLEDLAGSIR